MKFIRRMLGGIALLALIGEIGAAQETGIAAYYSDYFVDKSAANGEIYSHDALTAAHNGYPFGTEVRVTNLSNNLSVVVKINDRMRKNSTVLIDLSRRAAQELGFLKEGRTQVRVEPVGAGGEAPTEGKAAPFESSSQAPAALNEEAHWQADVAIPTLATGSPFVISALGRPRAW